MSQTAREAERHCHACIDGLKSIESYLNTQMHNMYTKIDTIIREREKNERKRMEKLLETVSEQLNRNVASLFENIIQREIRTHILPKIEKGLGTRIDQRIHDLSSFCMQAISSSLESKSMQQSLSRALKQGVLEAVVPSIENGMCEIRLQVLEKIKGGIPVLAEKIEQEEEVEAESQEETLDNIGDSLRIEESGMAKNDLYDMVLHLLEVNVMECFFYVLNSGDPDAFLFLLDRISLDAEMDLPAEILVSFVYQLISVTGLGTQRCHPSERKVKYTLLLSKALARIQQASLQEKEIQLLKKAFNYMQKNMHRKFFGNTTEEQAVLSLIESITTNKLRNA